jgi:hypothetical protein
MAEFGVGTRRTAFDVVEMDDGNFDYNEKVPVETSQKSSRDYWIRPIGGSDHPGPYTFTIEPMVDRYLQLNKARMEMHCRVTNEDDTKISLWSDVVAPVNLLGSSMWESVEVSLNGQPFSGASSVNCGYKSYLETLLSYDADSRNTHLHSQFFYLDSPGNFENMQCSEEVFRRALLQALRTGEEEPVPPIPIEDKAGDILDEYHAALVAEARAEGSEPPQRATVQATLKNEATKKAAREAAYQAYVEKKLGDLKFIVARGAGRVNKGFDNRFAIVAGSHSFDMFSPITHDFFKLNNHVGPGNKIDIRFTPHKDTFVLNSYLKDNKYKLHVDDMKLHLRTIELKERIAPPLTETYLMSETQMHKQLVGVLSPNTSFRIHNGGVMPKNVIVALVSTKAAEGAYDLNPFHFHHYYVDRMALVVNGEVVPSDGVRTDFTKANVECSRAYHWLYENTGAADSEKGNIVSWPAFQTGCFVQAWDLTPDKCNGLHNHNAEYGYIDLAISFTYPLRESIYVLYELVFPKVVINSKLTGTVAVLDIEA